MEISIVIPVYNVEKYIDKCILSIVNQSFQDFEIIIVNDGTKDKSIEKIKRFFREDIDIKLVNQKNAGLSAARNTGLYHAQGKYVCFIDSDDWIESTFLEKLYTVAEENQLDIVCSGYQKIYENSKGINCLRKRSEQLIEKGVLSGEDALLYQYQNSEYRVEVWDDLYRRQFLLENELKFKEGCLHEDELFTPLAMLKAKRVQFIDDTSYFYRQRENSIMSSQKNENRSTSLFVVSKYLVNYIDLSENLELQKYLAISARVVYQKSLVFGNRYKLPLKYRKKILYHLGKDKKIKDILILNSPKLAIFLQKTIKLLKL